MNSFGGSVRGGEVLFAELETFFLDVASGKELLQGQKIQRLIDDIRQTDVRAFIWTLLRCNSVVKPQMLKFFFNDNLLYKCPILRNSIENIISYYELTGDRDVIPVIEDSRRRIEKDFFYQLGRRCDNISIGNFLGKMTEENFRSVLGGLLSVGTSCTLDERKLTFNLLVTLEIPRKVVEEQSSVAESEFDLNNKTTYLDRCLLSHIQKKMKESAELESELLQ